MSSPEKCQYLRVVAITFVIVIALIFLIKYLFDSNVFLSNRMILEYLVEAEERSREAARILKRKTTDPRLQGVADAYIQRQDESIKNLEDLLKAYHAN